MTEYSGRMDKINRSLRWHRIEREQEEDRIARRKRRKKRLGQLLALQARVIPDLKNSLVWLPKKLWWFLGILDGGLAVLTGCILFCAWLTFEYYLA